MESMKTASKIGPYKLTEKIGAGENGTVYRAADTRTNHTVAVKILKERVDPNGESYLRFKRKAELLAAMQHPHIARFVESRIAGNQLYIITEDLPGSDLHTVIARNSLTADQKVELMLQAARALDYAHSQGIVHRDIRPGNILVTEESREVKILDFASTDFMNVQKLFAAGQTKGTESFAYMSPEQSGILRRRVDSRSDLYALGIVFYQLMTGSLPYQAEDLGELVHQHIARTPQEPAAASGDTAPIINDAILKLIKKDPDDRYQTAFGLAEDLATYLGLDEAKKSTVHIELGKKDRLKILNYRTRLVNRNREMKRLLKHLNETVRGKGFTSLVLGKSGIGKTRLVSELQRYTSEKNALFIEVSSTDRSRNQPYYPFIEMARRILEYAEKMPEGQRQEMYGSIRRKLGEEGRLLAKIIPEVEPVTGEYWEGMEFSRPENEMFFEKLRDFLLGAASPKRPLILSFDDAHFWDYGSIQLFSYLKQHLLQSSIYMLLAMQEEELPRVEQLMDAVREGRKAGEVEIITLTPLPAEDVAEFVSEVFGELHEGLHELSARLYESSQGNPLLVIENIKTLVDQDILSQGEEGWRVDVDALSDFRFSSSIADKIDLRLSQLSDEAGKVLRYAAVIGREFAFPTLYAVIRQSSDEISREGVLDGLREALNIQLIEESLSESGEIHYSFVHDNVVTSLLSNLSPEKIREIHRLIAERLESDYQGADKVYQLAYHFLQAGSNNKAYTYNTKAGRTALESYSFRQAVDFFYHALHILREFGKNTEKALRSRVKLSQEIANLNFQLGEYDRNIKLLEELSELNEQMDDTRSLAHTFYLLAKNHFFSGNQGKAMEYYYKLIPIAEKLNIPELLAIPYCAIGRAECFMANFSTSIDYIQKGLQLLPREEVLERVYALGVLAQSHAYIGEKKEAFDRLAELRERYGDTTNEMFRLYILFYEASVQAMVGDPEEALETSEACLRRAREQKNIALELFSDYFIGLAKSFMGKYKGAIREISKGLRIAEEYHVSVGVFMVYFNLAEIYALSGYTDQAEETLGKGKQKAELANQQIVGQWEQRIRAICHLTGRSPDLQAARQAIEGAVNSAKELGDVYEFILAQNRVVLAAVLHLNGESQQARTLYETAVSVYRAKDITVYVESAQRIWQRLTAPEELAEEDDETESELSSAGAEARSDFSYQRQLTYLLRLSEQLAEVHDMEQLLPRIISLALEVSGAERGALFLFEDSENQSNLVLREKQSIQPQEEAREMAYPAALVEKTTGEGKGQLIKDAERELADDETVTAHAMKSIITVPLITSGRVLGAIYLDNRQVKGLFTEENFELLKAFAIEAAISIENVRLYARVQETAKREQELEIATDIQTSILPEVLDTDAYEMGAYMRTATEVGGDYYDFEIGAEPYFGVFGDVSGHGLQSGIVMMMSEVAFKTLMSDPGLKKKPLPELYQMINATLYENIQQRLSRRSAVSLQYSHMYMTFHLFRFDTDGNFEIFGNDHAEPFICRAGSGEVIPIASRGFLMGILDEAVQGDKSYRFKLGPGDLLVLYSDGITEARLDASAGNGNGDGKQSMFGEKKLHSLIADHRGRRPQQIIDTVMRTLDSWTAEQEDDITMAVIKRRE